MNPGTEGKLSSLGIYFVKKEGYLADSVEVRGKRNNNYINDFIYYLLDDDYTFFSIHL